MKRHSNNIHFILLIAAAALSAIAISAISGNVSNPQTETGASLEALYAIPVSWIQVQLTVTNRRRPTLVIPLCGELLICDSDVALEQDRQPDGVGWKRTSTHQGGTSPLSGSSN